MEVILIGCAIVAACFFVIHLLLKLFEKRSDSPENEPVETRDEYIPPCHDGLLLAAPSAADIRNAPKGKYSWDENGCVFEINEDGSVTIVGTYDIKDLQLTPKEQLEEDALIEMLPRVWAVLGKPSAAGRNWSLSYIADEDYFNFNAIEGGNLMSDIKSEDIVPIPGRDSGIQSMLLGLTKYDKGVVVLMPSDDREFILSLGAQACINRCFDGAVKVAIVNPSEMGALWAAMIYEGKRRRNISFAYGGDNDYTCCNLVAEGNSFKVESLLPSSIILPLETNLRNLYIAKGAFVYSLLLNGILKNIDTSFIFPYPVSLVVRNGEQIVKIYELFDSMPHCPMSKTLKSIKLKDDDEISLVIGANELIDDLTEDLGNVSTVDITIQIDETSSIDLILESNNNSSLIKLGELIG